MKFTIKLIQIDSWQVIWLRYVMSKVLIIEDQQDICFLLTTLAKQRKIYPDCVQTITEALPLLRTTDYNVIFLDSNSPYGLNTEYIDKLKRYSNSKLFVFTAFGNDEIETLGLQKGAYAFIHKPFSYYDIQQIFQSL
ncbi:response regulator [Ferruginibacter albus]|uniref:response regulator n=1 Tax=Ferruginibacter albus TaxID=2875540 RepID=UPI001CC79B4B|nr:response regulator [Ferruginibacter albus]UAY52846.1 response regulator [Ferruginibacter albus]